MDTLIKDCTGVVLAGGENMRMPSVKAFIKVGGRNIIERNLCVLKRLFSEVFIVTNQPELYSYLDVPLIGDVYNIRGPMTGIFSALLNSSNSWVFISACDMPFLNDGLIKYMASKRKDCDAVVPVLKGKTEPLVAYYSRRFLTSMEKAILSGKNSIRDFFHDKRVRYIKNSVVKRLDPESKAFININTAEDIDYYLKPQDNGVV